MTERTRPCRYCGRPEEVWDDADCTAVAHGFHIPEGASDYVHMALGPGDTRDGSDVVCGTRLEAISTGYLGLVTCPDCRRISHRRVFTVRLEVSQADLDGGWGGTVSDFADSIRATLHELVGDNGGVIAPRILSVEED